MNTVLQKVSPPSGNHHGWRHIFLFLQGFLHSILEQPEEDACAKDSSWIQKK